MDTASSAPPKKPRPPKKTQSAVGDPTPLSVRVPIGELTLAEARSVVADDSLWTATRPLILFHFPQVTVDGYWDLTVADHVELLGFLKKQGLVDG